MFKPTVSSIVAKFNKTIDQLESLNKAKAIEVQAYNDKIFKLEEERAAADIEATRAKLVAGKIRSLIGDDESAEVVIEDELTEESKEVYHVQV